MCRTPAASVKATRRIPAFPHNGQHVDLSANALRLKLHGAPAALEDRAGCFYSTFSAIVAQNSIVSGLEMPATRARWLSLLYRKRWVLYAKCPFGGPQQVLSYLANYTHRVALSNRRIVAVD